MRILRNWSGGVVGAMVILAGSGCAGSGGFASPDGARPGGPAPWAASQGVEADQSGAERGPVLVTCGGAGHALVRQAIVEGEQVTLVECVDTAPITGSYAHQAPAPSPVQPQYAFAANGRSVGAVPEQDRVTVVERVVYQPQPAVRQVERPAAARPVQRTSRSWQKSAVIIGTTAGAGAGVGALVGGKKGALVGGAIGAGGATVWDQATRRR